MIKFVLRYHAILAMSHHRRESHGTGCDRIGGNLIGRDLRTCPMERLYEGKLTRMGYFVVKSAA